MKGSNAGVLLIFGDHGARRARPTPDGRCGHLQKTETRVFQSAIPSPKTEAQLVEEYFIENRTRLLEIAAYLDRLDRGGDGGAGGDFRMRAFHEALAVLCDGSVDRTKQIQMIFSDLTAEPLEALDTKSARGAYDRWKEVR
jgi:hypothetical protein